MEIMELTPANDTALAAFGAVARTVYADDKVWARGSETLFIKHRDRHATGAAGLFRPFVAIDGGTPVARAVAIRQERALGEDGAPQGYVGYFECVKDRPDAAAAVLARCHEVLREAGAVSAQAPKADNQLFGCQTGGFDLPHLCLTPHNPPWYRALFQASGYSVRHRISAFVFRREHAHRIPLWPTMGRTRTFDPTKLDREIADFHRLQPEIFGGRFGYVPRTLAEDRALIEGLLPVIDPELIVLAEDDSGRTIGILVCLPDFYQALAGQPVDRVRIVSIGVLPRHVRTGVGTRMAARLMQNLLAKPQYTYAEASLVLDLNIPPQALADRFGAEPGREFVLLEARL